MKIAKLSGDTNIDNLFYTGVEPQYNKDRRIHSIVPNDYNFSGNGKTDVTLVYDINELPNYFRSIDYITEQNIINYVFQSKTGTTNTEKWSDCTNDEKDTIIYYNQMKTSSSGDTESTLKVIHLLTTGQQPDVPSAAVFLRKNHAASVGRAKISVRERVDSDKLVEIMISYLTPHDIDQLMNTMATHLRRYKEYVLIGTVLYGNEPGLWDYINSQSIYSDSGLLEEGWVTLKGDLSELILKLNDLLWGDNVLEV